MRSLEEETARDLQNALSFERQKYKEEAKLDALKQIRESTEALEQQLQEANARIVELVTKRESVKQVNPEP